ncbi:hypothetical protein AB7813_08270 [Tardiphaga sp. 20_F10_N6_6]|uniref:hypothetical protein n=1 Tax=Tardiphaga sp. 20_F10_N6_6 TaxID=3240788 RepID=UPI003F8C9B23
MNKRTKRLHALIRAHALTSQMVADMLDRAKATVDMWRVGTPRTIPAHMLQLLEMKLAGDGNRNVA